MVRRELRISERVEWGAIQGAEKSSNVATFVQEITGEGKALVMYTSLVTSHKA